MFWDGLSFQFAMKRRARLLELTEAALRALVAELPMLPVAATAPPVTTIMPMDAAKMPGHAAALGVLVEVSAHVGALGR